MSLLQTALTTVRRRVRHGRLRDYLEAQSRHEQWLTATLIVINPNLYRCDDPYL